MTNSRLSVTRLIHAPRERVWAELIDPGRHHLFDASGTVGAPASNRPLALGETFRMFMAYTYDDGVVHYQSDNHVTRLETGRAVAWATALPDGDALGWTWTYELDDAAGGTRVVLTYDWSNAPERNIERFGVPATDQHGLAASLALLDGVCRTV